MKIRCAPAVAAVASVVVKELASLAIVAHMTIARAKWSHWPDEISARRSQQGMS